jgi:ribosomal protein L37AE/L43A
MKRVCSLCLQERHYALVKKYPHGLNLCTKCQDVIADLSYTVNRHLGPF